MTKRENLITNLRREYRRIEAVKRRNRINMRKTCATMGLFLPVWAFQYLNGLAEVSKSKRLIARLEWALNIEEVI